ncbi:hypothetical protein [Janthinobacterium sp. UMAB-60]|uniref:hypothetical protein n=1 Tax=Janthinobacterium sp. UMAB-60 TaxID=1365365 RepID=UPI001C5A295B|nr:hypothetical protein [Janthinobacterium sp. UMAB-60]
MADVFQDGMPNVNEELNKMQRAFAVGPYNALPLMGGVLSGPLVSSAYFWSTTFVAGQLLQIGVPNPTQRNYSVIQNPAQVQGNANLEISASALFFVSSGAMNNAIGTALSVGYNTQTGRSIIATGTINGGGADYAEYLIKSLRCGTIAPGQIVGIDADGKLTDKWNHAIAFMAKSTNPCMVGGDSWAQDLGERPAAPQRGEDDTDDAWAVKDAGHAAALNTFDAELEQLRQTVDRIAFAGQVPVNVLDATPGQYIVPVRDGEGIAGMAMDEDDMTLQQYMRAIGKVIAIEEDGRARIIVKVA